MFLLSLPAAITIHFFFVNLIEVCVCVLNLWHTLPGRRHFAKGSPSRHPSVNRLVLWLKRCIQKNAMATC